MNFSSLATMKRLFVNQCRAKLGKLCQVFLIKKTNNLIGKAKVFCYTLIKAATTPLRVFLHHKCSKPQCTIANAQAKQKNWLPKRKLGCLAMGPGWTCTWSHCFSSAVFFKMSSVFDSDVISAATSVGRMGGRILDLDFRMNIRRSAWTKRKLVACLNG